MVPFAAEQRLTRKLRRERLFNLLFVQVDAARTPDWQTIQQAAAVLRAHGELAPQRRDQLRRKRLNQTGPLHVEVCHNCLKDLLAEASTTPSGQDTVECNIRIDLARTSADARAWNLPVTQVTALMLAHEQEHCIQYPNRSQAPAVVAERRLAGKLGDARLLRYVSQTPP